MDHLPFWNWGPTGAGSGLGCGTSEIIDYVGTLNPSQFTGPYNHMVQRGSGRLKTPVSDHTRRRTATEEKMVGKRSSENMKHRNMDRRKAQHPCSRNFRTEAKTETAEL